VGAELFGPPALRKFRVLIGGGFSKTLVEFALTGGAVVAGDTRGALSAKPNVSTLDELLGGATGVLIGVAAGVPNLTQFALGVVTGRRVLIGGGNPLGGAGGSGLLSEPVLFICY
jgi:hypothetical protein